MAIPLIQIMVNAEQMRIFFDFDPTTYSAYNFYYDTAADMSSETLLAVLPNIPDSRFSRSHVIYEFRRSTLGYDETTTFYLRLKDTTGAVLGPIKYVPAVEDKIPSYNPVQLQGYDGNVWRKAVTDTAGRLDVV